MKATMLKRMPLRIVTWSHVYVGRLDELNGKRHAALAQYHAALLTAAALPIAGNGPV
jgi:hypothetical protein